jgi:hypothetical protein
MRRVSFLAMLVGGLLGLLRPPVASAQSSSSIAQSVNAVKFVCGRQAPASTDIRLPAEPPVKPGNYATKINVELLSAVTSPATEVFVSWSVSIAGRALSSSVPDLSLTQLQTVDITCAEIVHRAFPSGGAPQFINGYVNLISSPGVTLAVTGVYTSQGCSFGESGDSQGSPICSGPVSIEVVPEQAVTVGFPAT